ncbi:MAG TPA: hypothetical protein VJ327_07250 [Patescibacteria group bacterium]|nr:hypothetical protein [Patescibacteria group bacterium]
MEVITTAKKVTRSVSAAPSQSGKQTVMFNDLVLVGGVLVVAVFIIIAAIVR